MVLYKLPFAVFPIQDIYARSREDIKQWLDLYQQDPVRVVTKAEVGIGTLDNIVEVEKGELAFDLQLAWSGDQYAYVDFLPDFRAKIKLDSVPSFSFFQRRMEEYKQGNLYAVPTSPNGSFICMCYVPEDVFRALKACDVSAHEKKVEEYITMVNRVFKENDRIGFLPKPKGRRNFN